MVDFDAATTVASHPGFILQILIIEKREALLNAIEEYVYESSMGIKSNKIHLVKAKLRSLYQELRSALQRDYAGPKNAELATLGSQISSDRFQDLLTASNFLSDYLDRKQVTRFDTKRQYDTRRFEEHNQNVIG